jgi:hypothetical protein
VNIEIGVSSYLDFEEKTLHYFYFCSFPLSSLACPCPSLELKDKEEGTPIVMETNLQHQQAAFSIAVAP